MGDLVPNDDHRADWSATFARHGGTGEHLMEGINSRIDGVQAAILNVKVPHLPKCPDARRILTARDNELVAGVGDLALPTVAPHRGHVYHPYVIRTDNRVALKQFLADAGISTVLNCPNALPCYPGYAHLAYTSQDFPLAYAEQSRVLSSPAFPQTADKMPQYANRIVQAFFAGVL